MINPWLQIPWSDYEAHMAMPEVAQAQALSRLMASSLLEFSPVSLAVVGCATGNGFEHIDPVSTRRVVGIDINPAYLRILEARYSAKIPGLELIEADISAPGFQIEPVSMVFAGLVFEYVNVPRALRNIADCLAVGGSLVAVLQQPSPESAPVTVTLYKSLERLAPIMNLVPPMEFIGMCRSLGLREIRTDTMPLKKGKTFFVALCRKDPEKASAAEPPKLGE